jgi:hypothetical protein
MSLGKNLRVVVEEARFRSRFGTNLAAMAAGIWKVRLVVPPALEYLPRLRFFYEIHNEMFEGPFFLNKFKNRLFANCGLD